MTVNSQHCFGGFPYLVIKLLMLVGLYIWNTFDAGENLEGVGDVISFSGLPHTRQDTTTVGMKPGHMYRNQTLKK